MEEKKKKRLPTKSTGEISLFMKSCMFFLALISLDIIVLEIIRRLCSQSMLITVLKDF